MILSDGRLADDGKRLLGEGRYAVENLIPEERSGEEIHVASARDFRLADCSQMLYIYIYTQTQLFQVSIWRGFWRGFGEVSERDFGEQKSQNSCVLQWFLMVTIKNPLVFLGF